MLFSDLDYDDEVDISNKQRKILQHKIQRKNRQLIHHIYIEAYLSVYCYYYCLDSRES